MSAFMRISKMHRTMREFRKGKLRSGSKHGRKVTKRAQAIAIGLSQARKAGEDVPPRKGRRKHSTSKF